MERYSFQWLGSLLRRFGAGFKRFTKAKTAADLDRAVSRGFVDVCLISPISIIAAGQIFLLFYSTVFGRNWTMLSFGGGFLLGRIAGGIGLVCLAFKYLNSRPKPSKTGISKLLRGNPAFVFFGLVLGAMAVSTCLNGLTKAAIYGSVKYRDDLRLQVDFFLLFFPCGALVRDGRLKKLVMYLMMYAAVLQGIVMAVCQCYAHLPELTFYENHMYYGTFLHFNHVGYFYAMMTAVSIVLSMTEKNRYLRGFAWASFLFCSAGAALTASTGTLLACLAGYIFVLVLLLLTGRRVGVRYLAFPVLFVGAGMLATLGAPTFFTDLLDLKEEISGVTQGTVSVESMGTGRVGLWKLSLKGIAKRPLFGYGANGYNTQLWTGDPEVVDPSYRSHNELLEYSLYYGVPAALAYVCGVMAVFLRGLRRRSRLSDIQLAAFAAAFSYLVSSMIGVTTSTVTPIFFTMLGWAGAVNSEK